jgi:hypothetical protein
MAMDATESTPLLNGAPAKRPGFSAAVRNAFNVETRILLAGFLITLSFSFTQVS